MVSSNIVGYNKVTLSAGFNLIGSQFLNIGQGTQDINEFANNNTLPGLDDEYEFQSTLRVWNGVGYTTYGWYADGDGSDPEMDWPEADAKWIVNDQSDIAEVDMPAGQGYWIYTPTQATVTFSGEVPEGETKTIDVAKGFNLVANPFPEEIDIQTIQPDLPGLDANFEFQTTLRVWNGVGYTTYGWYADGDGSNPEMDWPEADAKWILNDQSDIADVKIPIGAGFWIYTPTAAGSVTFTK